MQNCNFIERLTPYFRIALVQTMPPSLETTVTPYPTYKRMRSIILYGED
jgi:hypothetical protein